VKSAFQKIVEKAIAANRGKHPAIRSPHEGLALIQEEVFELQQEVYSRKSKRDKHRMLNELTQIAAMCEIMAQDLERKD